MCEETVYWDLNYSLQFDSFGTEHIKAKVSELAKTLHNNLFTHSNFVFLDHNSVRQLLKAREPNSSEPLIIYNNLLRWAIFQLDRTLLEECDGAEGAEIPVTERSKLISKIREEKVFVYHEVVPTGAWLEDFDPSPKKLWVKLWRDVVWNILRGVPA